MIDKDRFRTKSGCLTCRRRKKKCDEQRPACADCSRMGLECQWPTEQDNAKDRRLRKIGKLPVRAPASQSPPPARVKDSASSTSSTLAVQRKEDVLSFALNSVMNRTIWDDETILLAFHVNTMLPTLVHRDAHRRYQDTTFTSSLLKNEKPLRDAALACVSMTLSRKLSSDKYWKSKMRKQALSYKNSAIIGIRERIAMGDVDGSEDWLFIAANQLTLFDDLDNNALTFSTHVRAAMDLLRCRHYSPKQKLLAQTAAGTDALDKELPAGRICYEGFLYVGITMMLFDREFDISDSAVEWEMIGEYFRTSPLPSEPGAEAWPILGFPFELFRLLVIMVILSRKSLMSDADIDLLGIISKDISKWYDTIHPTGKSSIGYPWLVAGNALLQYLLSQREEGTEFLDDAHKPENEVPPMLSKLEISIHFRPYNLWPLAVLNRISEDDHQREVLKALITKSLENIDGDIHKPAPEQIVNMFMIAPGILSYHPSRDNVPEKGSPPMKLVELRDEDD